MEKRISMYIFGICTLAIVVFVTETTLLQYIKIGGAKPDLVLIVVIYSAFYFNKSRALTIGLIFGLIQDSLSYGIFGLNMILKCLIVLGIVMLKRKLLIENPVVEYLISFIAVIINSFLVILLTQRLFWFNQQAILIIFYNFIMVPPIYYLIYRIRLSFTGIKGRPVKL